ncbi:MAG: transketolase family protein [Deltaproteobacteria bacterium]|nr:transketolase family protein [Deltaproteobacteria bacterium]
MEKAQVSKNETKPLKNYVDINPQKKVATRAAFGKALVSVGENNQNIVVLDADLSVSTKSSLFAEKFPDRFFEMGIAESNMIGTAAGLALSGKIPYLCSFGCFVAGRFETIRISIAYNQVNCRIIGTHAGIGIGEDGYTQMALEDMALMRSLPGMGVLQPADDIETQRMIEFLSNHHQGPVYVRLTRQALPQLFNQQYVFEYGKGVILEEGKDIALVATGGVVHPAYEAAQKLKEKGYTSSVVNIHTIKPLDETLIQSLAHSHQWMFTIEDHTIMGGLGSAVSEVLAGTQNHAVLSRIGIQDIYGESGTPEALYEKYGLSTAKIVEHILRQLES